MLMKTIERYGFLLHGIGILIFLSAPLLFFPFPLLEALPDAHFRYLLLTKIATNALLTAVFYLNMRVLTPNLLLNKNQTTFFGILTVLLIVILVLDTTAFHLINKEIPFSGFHRPQGQGPKIFGKPGTPGMGGPSRGWLSIPQVISHIVSFALVIISGSIIVLLRDRIRDREDRQQILFEKVNVELAVLKHQVSPHFLFNTLNNIRWLARKKSDKTEEAIVELSQLLRYMIYQVNDETVPLVREIDHLERYINLQKMRLSDLTQIRFEVRGDIDSQLVEPLLLIPFVENAFKYGVHNQQSSEISISIETTPDRLVFECENSIFEHNYSHKKEESGLGIANVRRRLEFYYHQKHVLKIKNVDDKFVVRLELDMSGENES